MPATSLPPPSPSPANKDKKLLDQLRDAIRAKHYSYRTEQTYSDWCKRYILYHQKRHPAEMGVPEIQEYIIYLATDQQVAASTHTCPPTRYVSGTLRSGGRCQGNQALSASFSSIATCFSERSNFLQIPFALKNQVAFQPCSQKQKRWQLFKACMTAPG